MDTQVASLRRYIMIKKSFAVFVFFLCLVLLFAGCPKKRVAVSRDQASEEAARMEREREAREAKERELARLREEELKKPAGEEVEKTLVAKKEPGIQGEVFETKLLKDIHFDFDKYEVRPEDEAILKENAAFLKNNPKMRIQIEGHCDERGTVEYNLALGERRANNTKKYLVFLGIPADLISTISYGKERPLDKGHNEEAWAKNRRAHIVVISK
jgi:peptidoglycan-associated lipoprotein